jgi:hypothetical protein
MLNPKIIAIFFNTQFFRATDKYVWRCRICKSTRSLRENTFFSNSKLELQQLVDLIFYWSQGLDAHLFFRRHVQVEAKNTIADWKNFLRDICVDYVVNYPSMIGGDGHVVEIDQSA